MRVAVSLSILMRPRSGVMWLRMIFRYPLIVESASRKLDIQCSAYTPTVGVLPWNFSFLAFFRSASVSAACASSRSVNPPRVSRFSPSSGFSGSIST